MVQWKRAGFALASWVLLAGPCAFSPAADEPNLKAQVDEQLKALKADLAAVRTQSRCRSAPRGGSVFDADFQESPRTDEVLVVIECRGCGDF